MHSEQLKWHTIFHNVINEQPQLQKPQSALLRKSDAEKKWKVNYDEKVVRICILPYLDVDVKSAMHPFTEHRATVSTARVRCPTPVYAYDFDLHCAANWVVSTFGPQILAFN